MQESLKTNTPIDPNQVYYEGAPRPTAETADRELGISAPENKGNIDSENSITGISESAPNPTNGTENSLQAARQRIEAAQQAVDAARPANTNQYPPAA